MVLRRDPLFQLLHVRTDDDPNNCGGCNQRCAGFERPHFVPTCTAGTCGGRCEEHFADCMITDNAGDRGRRESTTGSAAGAATPAPPGRFAWKATASSNPAIRKDRRPNEPASSRSRGLCLVAVAVALPAGFGGLSMAGCATSSDAPPADSDGNVLAPSDDASAETAADSGATTGRAR